MYLSIVRLPECSIAAVCVFSDWNQREVALGSRLALQTQTARKVRCGRSTLCQSGNSPSVYLFLSLSSISLSLSLSLTLSLSISLSLSFSCPVSHFLSFSLFLSLSIALPFTLSISLTLSHFLSCSLSPSLYLSHFLHIVLYISHQPSFSQFPIFVSLLSFSTSLTHTLYLSLGTLVPISIFTSLSFLPSVCISPAYCR